VTLNKQTKLGLAVWNSSALICSRLKHKYQNVEVINNYACCLLPYECVIAESAKCTSIYNGSMIAVGYFKPVATKLLNKIQLSLAEGAVNNQLAKLSLIKNW